MPACASKQDVLELANVRYVIGIVLFFSDFEGKNSILFMAIVLCMQNHH